MLQLPDPRKFVEGLIEGLLQFVVAVVGSWLAVAVRPVRGALRLASDANALSSRSVLFIACMVPGAAHNLGANNLAQAIRGGSFTPVDLNDPWYTGYDQSGGLWFYVTWALLGFAVYEMAAQFLGWMFSDGLAARRRLRVAMLRYVFAAIVILETIAALIFRDWYTDADAFLQRLLVYAALSYPLLLVILRFARRMKRGWTRPLIGLVVVATLYPITRLASDKLVEHVLIPMFMPEVNTSVVALQCSPAEGGLQVEAILFNQGSRPVAIDRRVIGVRVVGPPWAPFAPAGYDPLEKRLDPRTARVQVRPGKVPMQTLSFDPGRLEVLGPGATLRFSGLAKGTLALDPVVPRYCRLEASAGGLGIRSTNSLILRRAVTDGSD